MKKEIWSENEGKKMQRKVKQSNGNEINNEKKNIAYKREKKYKKKRSDNVTEKKKKMTKE